ncbi:hypothetical protein F4859DRAFT_84764 [Xylaria cf. heliscus]|nr:hypothetical protein F4859DRAFT_84764 [Xylaria cf. heliscus]
MVCASCVWYHAVLSIVFGFVAVLRILALSYSFARRMCSSYAHDGLACQRHDETFIHYLQLGLHAFSTLFACTFQNSICGTCSSNDLTEFFII